MQTFKYLIGAALTGAALVFAALPAAAQENSLGTYSPYTMYGLGDLNRSTGANFVGMGGASIGFRNDGSDTNGDLRLNVSNPAALSALPRQSFIFDVGMAGSNRYLSQQSASSGLLKTSFNTFNFNNITIALPLASRLGFAVSVTPYSRVGYKIHTDDESYLADLGVVRYYYDGSGDITEAKAAVGWKLFKNFSLGAEINYMWGNIDRKYEAQIAPYTGSGTYNSVSASTNEKVARVFPAFGMQYSPVNKAKTRVTIGATYRMGGKLNSDVRDYIPSNNVYADVIRLNEFKSATHMPRRIGIGAYFHRPKWAVGGDWISENWGDHNQYDELNEVGYVNTNTLRMGARYTPNRMDIRGKVSSFFNRMTYKAGFRTGGNYMEFRGVEMNDRAVTFGVDVPFKAMNVSTLSLGFEYGSRGSLQKSLIREKYFKINTGVMLFGGDYDYWFQKYKYN